MSQIASNQFNSRTQINDRSIIPATLGVNISITALFIIMCMAAARCHVSYLPQLTIGFSATGVIANTIISYKTNSKNKTASKFYAILAITNIIILALGLLHLKGKLNGYQLGCGMLITTFVFSPFSSTTMLLHEMRTNERKNNLTKTRK